MSSNNPTELFSVMNALRSALKSIDVRTIAVSPKLGTKWQNLVTSVFMTEKSVDEIKKQQESIPILRNNSICLYLNAYPFDNNFFGELINAQVKFITQFGNEKVYFRKFDPTRLKVRSTKERITGSYNWILQSTDTGTLAERGELWNIVGANEVEAKRQGFSHISKLIEHRLRIDYCPGTQKDFELVIPSLASIRNTRFVKTRFELEVKKVEGLTDLQLILSHTRKNTIVSIKPRKVKEEKNQLSNAFQSRKETFELDNLLPYDQIDVKLLLGESALTLDETWKQAPLENVVEPFMRTLIAFCPIEKLQQMIFKPEHYGKNPDKIFENAITWLVSLSGYSSIPLWFKIQRKTGKGQKKKFKDETFEKLRTETGCEIGSADIIAYEENKRILLIDCDIGSPDENKIRKLVDTGRQFSTLRKTYGQLKIVPVLVTPKKYDGQPKNGLSIVDQKSLKRILEELSKGNRERARDIFCEFGFSFS